MRDDAGRVQDILEAIEKIESQLEGGREVFIGSELLHVWAVHHLQIIGEAASRLSNVFKQAHPEIPWAKIIGMRNVLIHDYTAIDLDIVWVAVERDLPALKRQVQALQEDLTG
jgi:uncharacterized protein with HEPN domain